MTSPASACGGWKQVQTLGDIPKGRSSSAIGIIKNNLYVFSGEHVPRHAVDGDLYRLDLNTGRWTKIGESDSWPCARVGHAGTTSGDKLYIYGGRTGVDMKDSTLDDLWSFDPTNNRWHKLPNDGDVPVPLSYHTLTSLDSMLYLFGGCTKDGRTNQLWLYDLKALKWKILAKSDAENAPVARGGSSIVGINGQLHVLFGYNGKEELGDHYLFDLSNLAWVRHTPTPTSISSHHDIDMCYPHPPPRSVTDVVALVNVGKLGSLFVFGGEYTPSVHGHEGAGKYHQDAWLYDLETKLWIQIKSSNPPSGRGWFNSAALSDGKSVIIFGGFDGVSRINDVHIWDDASRSSIKSM